MTFRHAAALFALLFLPACGMLGLGASEPTVIDGSSPEAFERTVDAARGELSPGDRLKFEAALTAVRGRQFAAANDRAEMGRRVRRALDGQTAQEVVAGVDQWTERFGNQAADTAFDVKRELRNATR